MVKRRTPIRMDIAKPIAKALRDFGYPDVTWETVRDVIDAWIDDGKRGSELPHGVIGRMAGRQLAELEEASPGALARIPRDEDEEPRP